VALLSDIEGLLRKEVAREDGQDGLQFIVFLPKGPVGALGSASASARAANFEAIKKLIHLHGLDVLRSGAHTAEEQVRLWEDRLQPVQEFFEKVQRESPPGPEGSLASLTRLVLDIEVGGLLYATVGDYGWVYAATFDQQPLNTGEAESHLIRVVDGLLKILSGQVLGAGEPVQQEIA
jgi:hypothetical protein